MVTILGQLPLYIISAVALPLLITSVGTLGQLERSRRTGGLKDGRDLRTAETDHQWRPTIAVSARVMITKVDDPERVMEQVAAVSEPS